MDKYVIKSNRKNKEKGNPEKSKKKRLKQIKIEELPRVVVVEDIHRMNAILNDSRNEEEIKKALEGLKKINPAREIMLKTKIGHKVNSLRKHENATISTMAREIFRNWKKFYKDSRSGQQIEVRCDARTELFRMKARKLLSKSLEVEDNTPELIEREVFRLNSRKTNNLYKRRIRKLCLLFKSRRDVRDKVVNREISVDSFCKEES